jgi:hypothetical protein
MGGFELVHTSVSTGRDVPLDVPGQRNFLVPVSLCPGTRAGANVLGQIPLSRDVPGQNHFPKRTQKTGKGRSKTGKRRSITGKRRSKTGKDVPNRKGRSKTGKDVLKQEIIEKK